MAWKKFSVTKEISKSAIWSPYHDFIVAYLDRSFLFSTSLIFQSHNFAFTACCHCSEHPHTQDTAQFQLLMLMMTDWKPLKAVPISIRLMAAFTCLSMLSHQQNQTLQNMSQDGPSCSTVDVGGWVSTRQ